MVPVESGPVPQAPTKDNGSQTDASWNELAMEKLRQEKKKKKKAANTKEDASCGR